jgi:hypothetical protein
MTFDEAMDEIDATRKEHFAALSLLNAQLRNAEISVESYRAQVRPLDDIYCSRMRRLIQRAKEMSWAGVRGDSADRSHGEVADA